MGFSEFLSWDWIFLWHGISHKKPSPIPGSSFSIIKLKSKANIPKKPQLLYKLYKVYYIKSLYICWSTKSQHKFLNRIQQSKHFYRLFSRWGICCGLIETKRSFNIWVTGTESFHNVFHFWSWGYV